jgi:orotidine-5'-phosphate decarboxylase
LRDAVELLLMTATKCDALAFALDYPNLSEAQRGAELIAPHVGVLKVGLELFVREGAAATKLGDRLGCKVFLDLKLHDIPETVDRAVASAIHFGVRYLTLHASGGPRMLEAAQRRVERERANLTLLAVTVLTSLDEADLSAIGVSESPSAHVLRLARFARQQRIPGLVCSTAELGVLRQELGEDAVLVTPGIRPAGSSAGDQKRVGTPTSAIQDGANLLVVGRPIRDAADPAAAARAIADEIAKASA